MHSDTFLLEKMGLRATSPPIRSSHYSVALSDPFIYYLTQRLGLYNALSWSRVLSHGSWFHRAAQLDTFLTPDQHPEIVGHTDAYLSLLRARQAELTTIAKNRGIQPPGLACILGREEEEALTALACYTVSARVPLSRPGLPVRRLGEAAPTWRSWLSSKFDVLAQEFEVRGLTPTGHPVVILIDAVLYHREHHTIWLLDYKTTGLLPLVRMSICPVEFQTQLYLDTAARDFQTETRTGLYSLLDGRACEGVYGMVHVIFQKPNLIFGYRDRDKRAVTITPTRGKNKGIERTEYEYFGEPTLSNYCRRITNWALATEEYTHLAETRTEPPVNISCSPLSRVLDPSGLLSYHSRLKYLSDLATRDPHPSNFLSNPAKAFSHGDLTPWADFMLNPLSEWHNLISAHNLIPRLPSDPVPHPDTIKDP